MRVNLMTNIVIATAGHIDHGKTTLIKALTGKDLDSTKEEKQRGLTINLGFSYLTLPSGNSVGIVDVPGHERFIKNMVAGLAGIDLVMLVIDAGEGVMPQTKEHLDILHLLGIKDILVVLSKVNRVDEELLELVKLDIDEHFQKNGYDYLDIIQTDAIDGLGLETLKQRIDQFIGTVDRSEVEGYSRLNVDRTFSVKGFGTIVTGALLDGSLSIGDNVEVFTETGQFLSRVRNIQVHEQNKEQAFPGQRTAINLVNIEADQVERGAVVTNNPYLNYAWILDAKVKCLPHHEAGISLWDRVRVLVGTREVMARVVPIGANEVAPGEECFLQLRLEKQLVVKNGDRLILRMFSPITTIGGGEVLEAQAVKHKRFNEDTIQSLVAKDSGSLEVLFNDFVMNKSNPFFTIEDIVAYTNYSQEDIETFIQQALDDNAILSLNKTSYIDSSRIQDTTESIKQLLAEYHKKNKLRDGMPLEELQSKLRDTYQINEIQWLLQEAKDRHEVIIEDNFVANSDFEVVYNPYQLKAKELLEKNIETSGFYPLKVDDLYNLDPHAKEVLESLDGKTVVYLAADYVISMKYYLKSLEFIVDFLNESGKMTLADFRDHTDSSRKATMLILEYVDKQKVTKREENYRILHPEYRKILAQQQGE